MYEGLFQTPLAIQTTSDQLQSTFGLSSNDNLTNLAQGIHSKLKSQDYELKAGSINDATDQFAPAFNRSKLIQSNGRGNFTNDYLMDQKLRNSGLYSKLKNKTIYSQSEFVATHSMLNSGIL